MERKWIVAGLLLLITGIILGAFGAHALKGLLAEEKLVSFETGVRYQLIHAVAFMAVPYIAKSFGANTKWVFRLLVAGVLFFSVSIYLLTLRELWGMDALRYFGPVTPVGGVLLIVGWTALLIKVLQNKQLKK